MGTVTAHFKSEETEAWKDEPACPGLHSLLTVAVANAPQCPVFRMGHGTPFLAHVLVCLKVKGKIMLNSVSHEKYFSCALLVCLSCFSFKITFEIRLLFLGQSNLTIFRI